MSRSEDLRSRILHEILVILSESEGFVPLSEIEQQVEQRVELDDWARETRGRQLWPRWRSYTHQTTMLVSAGFIQKSSGRWRITEAGRGALSMAPSELHRFARDADKEKLAAGKKDGTRGRRVSVAADRGRVLAAGLRVLADSATRSQPWSVVLGRLPALISEDLDRELRQRDEDWPMNYGYTTFYPAVGAGWLVRDYGPWTITETGIKALEEWPDPEALWDAARQLAGRSGASEPARIPYLGSWQDHAQAARSLYQVRNGSVQDLVSDISRGLLALPDIQRPFVWKNAKVRDLLDSMFRGFPFGFVLTWRYPLDSSSSVTARAIGQHGDALAAPHALVIDGQQRLTSLYAVMTGDKVVDEDFQTRRIRIGFHPLRGEFAVADASIDKNPEWIADVSELFIDPSRAFEVESGFLEKLHSAREIDGDQERAVRNNLRRLLDLQHLPMQVLEIAANASEEEVAEIFVRINSKGQKLRQSDFILTLLAVFWEEGRTQLEEFSKACVIAGTDEGSTPFNRLLRPGPDEMIRVSIALGLILPRKSGHPDRSRKAPEGR